MIKLKELFLYSDCFTIVIDLLYIYQCFKKQQLETSFVFKDFDI
jgi:hypothetical protein